MALSLLSLILCILLSTCSKKSVRIFVDGATWCVARSDATQTVLQTAIDYACSGGGDCSSLQPNGLCFLPNTIESHASYAFNSYYQRSEMAPGSCDFAGTATLAKTDPSYGSCVYPDSVSKAGGISASTTPGEIGTTTTPGEIGTTTTPDTSTTTSTPVNGDNGNSVNSGTSSNIPVSMICRPFSNSRNLFAISILLLFFIL